MFAKLPKKGVLAKLCFVVKYQYIALNFDIKNCHL